MDQQLLCHTLLQYPPISSDLPFCQQTSPEHHAASTQSCLLPQHLLAQPLHNNQTIWITRWRMVCSSFFAYQKSRKDFFYLSRQQHLMLRQAGLRLSGLQSLQPSSHKPTFWGLRKNFPLSIGYSSLADKRFLSSSSPMSSQSMQEQDGCGTVHCLTQRLGGANHLNKNKTESKKKSKKPPHFHLFSPSLTA